MLIENNSIRRPTYKVRIVIRSSLLRSCACFSANILAYGSFEARAVGVGLYSWQLVLRRWRWCRARGVVC